MSAKKVIACIVTALAVSAFVAALAGARHQFVLAAGLGAILALVFWPNKTDDQHGK